MYSELKRCRRTFERERISAIGRAVFDYNYVNGNYEQCTSSTVVCTGTIIFRSLRRIRNLRNFTKRNSNAREKGPLPPHLGPVRLKRIKRFFFFKNPLVEVLKVGSKILILRIQNILEKDEVKIVCGCIVRPTLTYGCEVCTTTAQM